MRRSEPDAINAVDSGDHGNEFGQVDSIAVVRLTLVCIDVLAQQVDLAHILAGEVGNLGDDIVQRTTDFFATGIGYDTERTIFAAAFHDRYEC